MLYIHCGGNDDDIGVGEIYTNDTSFTGTIERKCYITIRQNICKYLKNATKFYSKLYSNDTEFKSMQLFNI